MATVRNVYFVIIVFVWKRGMFILPFNLMQSAVEVLVSPSLKTVGKHQLLDIKTRKISKYFYTETAVEVLSPIFFF